MRQVDVLVIEFVGEDLEANGFDIWSLNQYFMNYIKNIYNININNIN